MDSPKSKFLWVSHSGLETYARCPHKYYLSLVEGIEPVEKSRAPSFGSAGHEVLDAYWQGKTMQELLNQWAHSALNWGLDTEDSILGHNLIIGYHTLYGDKSLRENYEEVESEKQFEVPIIGPDGTEERFVGLR